LHFPDGELIRTTPEHPFFVVDHGWTPAGSLKAGDRVVTLIGDSVPVAEVYDTGEWEVVYNLRVAEYHTYFVGDETWGFAAWAHNTYAWQIDPSTFKNNFDKWLTAPAAGESLRGHCTELGLLSRRSI
jgi:hypothetical protein